MNHLLLIYLEMLYILNFLLFNLILPSSRAIGSGVAEQYEKDIKEPRKKPAESEESCSDAIYDALSSPESEFYALTKGCSLAIGTQNMFRDMQVDHQFKVHCDASSGISLAHRRGFGRARHISTRYL